MTLEQQFQTVLTMILSGFFIGFFFDGYRVLKGKINVKPWVVFIIDVSFGIFSAFFIFSLLLWSNRGQLRLIIIATFLIGLWIYYQSLSRSVIRIWLTIYAIIYSLWNFLLKTMNVMIIRPILFLYKIVLVVIGFIISTFYGFIGFSKKILKPPTVKFYNKTKRSSIKLKEKIKRKAGIRSFLKKWLRWRK